MKNFNEEVWNDAQRKKNWEELDLINDLDDQVKKFTDMVTEALDEVAPVRSFKIKSNYVFGLSTDTKELMKKGIRLIHIHHINAKRH